MGKCHMGLFYVSFLQRFLCMLIIIKGEIFFKMKLNFPLISRMHQRPFFPWSQLWSHSSCKVFPKDLLGFIYFSYFSCTCFLCDKIKISLFSEFNFEIIQNRTLSFSVNPDYYHYVKYTVCGVFKSFFKVPNSVHICTFISL